MAPSARDQKKAEIVRSVEEKCSAEIKVAKAVYEYDCQLVEEKYEIKKEQACHDLEKEELKELREIERLYEAKMEPIKAKHAEELTAIRERFRIATPEAGLPAPATSETPSSTSLVTASVSTSSEDHDKNGHKKPVMHFI